ncbi:hypothetical protein ACH47Z_18270 [Streptomyces sp. NPDC020192]|uniref:hypothetical protein n=1 Tax=Streptomyces sp. NPDC020192 TaxID=3365066 RepID=UPI00379DFE32
MNESTPLAKAEAAVTEAATNTDVIRLALAAVELAKTAQQQPTSVVQQTTQPFDTRKWLTIGGLVIVGGCVACFLAAALALVAVAVAVGGACATACLLILRALWRDFQRGR